MSKRVAIVLSGCGVFDGSEIHEAVSILIALDKRKAQITYLRPTSRSVRRLTIERRRRNRPPET